MQLLAFAQIYRGGAITMNEHRSFGSTIPRRSLRGRTVLVTLAAALIVAIQPNVGWAHEEERGDESLSWEAALAKVEPAEAYEPLPEYLLDFPWTWQERASQAADEIRDTYPDDFSWFTFVPEVPGARIGFAGAVPIGATEIIETLRSFGERVEVFSDQSLTEHELFAANLYLTAAAQDVSATTSTVEIRLGETPRIVVAGVMSEADTVGGALAAQLNGLAEKLGAPALNELRVEFDVPVNHEPTDPVYDGMVLGPQIWG
jgi:hypothetical protein